MSTNKKITHPPIPEGDYITKAVRVSELGKELSSKNNHIVLQIIEGEFQGRELFTPLSMFFRKGI